MKSLLSRPIWRAFIICIPLWFIFGNFLLAAMTSILVTFLIGMIMELVRLEQRKKDSDSHPPRT